MYIKIDNIINKKKTAMIGCNISIPNLENSVTNDNFDLNIFQINIDFVIFRLYGSFLRFKFFQLRCSDCFFLCTNGHMVQ